MCLHNECIFFASVHFCFFFIISPPDLTPFCSDNWTNQITCSSMLLMSLDFEGKAHTSWFANYTGSSIFMNKKVRNFAPGFFFSYPLCFSIHSIFDKSESVFFNNVFTIHSFKNFNSIINNHLQTKKCQMCV